MKNNLKIKVCGMRAPENIQEIIASEPDYLGFIFYRKSKRFVGESPDPVIFQQVDSSIQKAAVVVNETVEEVLRICKTFRLEIAQLHGKESAAYCRTIRQQGIIVFKAFSIDDTFDFTQLKDYQNAVDFFLFDTKGKLPGGTGKKFDWTILENYNLSTPFFLSGGIGSEDVSGILAIEHPALYGVDINSGFELEPALKDGQRVEEFINGIRM